MTILSHSIEHDKHFLVFPTHIDHESYALVFSQAYTLLGDLTQIKLLLDLSAVDYINSGFIGMISELYSLIEEKEGHMVILANTTLDDMFRLVGFNDYVDIVLDRTEAVRLLSIA